MSRIIMMNSKFCWTGVDKSNRIYWIKETVVYRCSKVITRLRENKSGSQTLTERNTSTMRREKQQKHWTATKTNIHIKGLFDNNCHIPNMVQEKNWLVKPAFMASQISHLYCKELRMFVNLLFVLSTGKIKSSNTPKKWKTTVIFLT